MFIMSGRAGLSAFLITSDEGHVLIDGGLPENAPQIVNSIEALGFDTDNIRLLLNSHAHFDHSGGLAALKEMTGAPLAASEGDRSALEGGFYLGAEDKPEYGAPPVTVDWTFTDGAVVSVTAEGEQIGGLELSAWITPGHTRGCTSFTLTVEEGGESYDVLLFCSASVAGNRLVGPPQYDGIIEDYRYTFERTAEWTPDVFLSNHPFFFNMEAKRRALYAGDPLAFVAPDEFPRFMTRAAEDFERRLAEQQAALEAP